jgi:hypothetical protein
MLKVLDESLELAKRFENVYASIDRVLGYQETWKSSVGPGYDGAVNLDLKPGEIARTKDLENNVRIILVGTDLDTVVVYERVTGSTFSLTYNANAALDFLLGGSYLSIAQFSLVVTDYDIKENIGFSLANLYNRIGRRKAHKTDSVRETTPVPK